MNLKDGPTTTQLGHLLQPCNDEAAHHMLWVEETGDVHVTPLPRNTTPATWVKAQQGRLKFRLDTLVRGKRQVGPDAAANDEHLSTLLSQLVRQWGGATAG